MASLPETLDPLVVVVSRAEVEAMDTSAALTVLKRLLESPTTARAFVERVDIAFHGYDQTNQELFEIPEVRNFVCELDQQFPFLALFLVEASCWASMPSLLFSAAVSHGGRRCQGLPRTDQSITDEQMGTGDGPDVRVCGLLRDAVQSTRRACNGLHYQRQIPC